MKKCFFTFILTALFFAACDKNEEPIKPIVETQNLRTHKAVTFAGPQNIDDVSVLVFPKSGNDFKYQESITTGWDENNKTRKNLTLGADYKFLFVKGVGTNTLFSPALDQKPTFSQLQIKAKTGKNNDYVQPVDEIWLPVRTTLADSVYTIGEGDLIKNKLTRAVSQVKIRLKRATYDNGVRGDSLKYSAGKNIMQSIQSINLEIDGVGEALTYEGAKGLKKMEYSYNLSDAVINQETGFAHLEGPFVFPPQSTGNSTLNFTIKYTTDPLKTSVIPVSGKIEKNKKLEITLWMSASYQLIDITYETDFFADHLDGDIGIWD